MRVLEEVCEMSLLEITQYFEVRGDAVNYNIIEDQDSNPAGQTSLSLPFDTYVLQRKSPISPTPSAARKGEHKIPASVLTLTYSK
jgi:hypothetical protein